MGSSPQCRRGLLWLAHVAPSGPCAHLGAPGSGGLLGICRCPRTLSPAPPRVTAPFRLPGSSDSAKNQVEADWNFPESFYREEEMKVGSRGPRADDTFPENSSVTPRLAAFLVRPVLPPPCLGSLPRALSGLFSSLLSSSCRGGRRRPNLPRA